MKFVKNRSLLNVQSLQKRSIDDGKNNKWNKSDNKNIDGEHGIGGNVFGFRYRDAVYYRPDSGGGKYASSDASSGADLRICLRMEIRSGGWIYRAAASKCNVRNAAADADGFFRLKRVINPPFLVFNGDIQCGIVLS